MVATVDMISLFEEHLRWLRMSAWSRFVHQNVGLFQSPNSKERNNVEITIGLDGPRVFP